MPAPLPDPSPLLLYGFLGLLGVTIGAAIHWTSRAGAARTGTVVAVLGVWMAVTGGLGASGLLGRWDVRPPPMIGLLVVGLIGTVVLARGRFGSRLAENLPLGILIGFQAFRFPLELLLHRAYVDGLMPVQMCFEGWNFDIVSGVLGLVLGVWSIRRRGEIDRRVAWAFNVLGLALLANIVGIAIASTPIIAAFGPEAVNRWVTDAPFVWLPLIFVTFALFGHIVLTRRLVRGDPAG